MSSSGRAYPVERTESTACDGKLNISRTLNSNDTVFQKT